MAATAAARTSKVHPVRVAEAARSRTYVLCAALSV